MNVPDDDEAVVRVERILTDIQIKIDERWSNLPDNYWRDRRKWLLDRALGRI